METAFSQQVVAVLKIKKKSGRARRHATFFAATNYSLLHKSDKKQACQVLSASKDAKSSVARKRMGVLYRSARWRFPEYSLMGAGFAENVS